jgi:hypothetical protein
MLSVTMPNVVIKPITRILHVIMLNIIMQNAVMLNAIILNVVMLNAIMMIVVAPLTKKLFFQIFQMEAFQEKWLESWSIL